MIKNKFLLVFLLLLFSSLIKAQLPNLPANLENVRSSEIPEDRISQVAAYLVQNNVSEQQFNDLLLSRGMNSREAALLNTRVQRQIQVGGTSVSTKFAEQTDSASVKSSSRYKDEPPVYISNPNPMKIFGLEIFNNGVLSFEPNLKIATPMGYVIGPDDEIVITIFGYQEAKYSLIVSSEGGINIPNVGLIYVSGLTIEAASQIIKNKLSASGYSNIRTGLTKLNVGIGRIRSIKVTILGEVKRPGTHTLPSLATTFNALYVSGGPNDIGSMRNVEIIRGGKIIGKLDIYDFLIKGDLKGNLNLRDQDVIRIPPYNVRVSLEGKVKRTGLYEIKPGENLGDLLNFAGGFNDSAFTATITSSKVTDSGIRIKDIPNLEFSTYKPGRSEAFFVKRMIDKYTNRITIGGAVNLPGDFEFKEGMNLKELVDIAGGFREDAFMERGLIKRFGDNMVPQYISFNPMDVVEGKKPGLILLKNDFVKVTYLSDLKSDNVINIIGEVRMPGAYNYIEKMSLKDILLIAGGFSDAALPQRIEISHRLRKDSFNVNDIDVADVVDVTSILDLEKKGSDVTLRPYDLVIVRSNPTFKEQTYVSIEGEVVFPGPYTIKNKTEHISDIILRAGGLTKQAYKEGGYLTRLNNQTVINQVNRVKVLKIQEQLKDSTGKVEKEVARPIDQIAIKLSSIFANPGGKEDLVVENGDVITIPKAKMEVRISGEVLFPTRVVFQDNLNMKDYIGRAGGFTDNSRKARVYVLYPNGNAAKTSNFLLFRKFPKITPGSEIIVPKVRDVERRKMSAVEVVGITTAITGLAGILLQLIR